MPQEQAVAKKITCEVCAGNRWQISRQTFGDASRYIVEALEETDMTEGHLKLIPIQQYHGSSAKRQQVVTITRLDGDNALRCIIQLGSNNSAWEYRLVLPVNARPDQFRLRLEDGLEKKRGQARKPEPVLVKAVAASALVQDEPEQKPEPLSVTTFVNDLDRVALTIFSLFPLRHTHAPVGHFIDALRDACDWSEADAGLAISALGGKKYIRVLGHMDKTVCILESPLSELLCSLGALKEQDRICVESPAPVPSEKARIRADVHEAYLGGPVPEVMVDKVRAPARLVEPPRTVPSAQKVSATPVAVPSGTFPKLDELQRKAAAFAEAQENLRRSEPARNALAERHERVRQELAAVETEKRKLEEGCAEALRIVSNPEYSEAAHKIQKILAIMEE